MLIEALVGKYFHKFLSLISLLADSLQFPVPVPTQRMHVEQRHFNKNASKVTIITHTYLLEVCTG